MTDPRARPAVGTIRAHCRVCVSLPSPACGSERAPRGSGFTDGQLCGVAAQPGAENRAALQRSGAPWQEDYIPNPERPQGVSVAGFAAMSPGTEHRGHPKRPCFGSAVYAYNRVSRVAPRQRIPGVP